MMEMQAIFVGSRKVSRRQDRQNIGNFKFVHLARWPTMMLQWHQKSKLQQTKACNLCLIPIVEDEGGLVTTTSHIFQNPVYKSERPWKKRPTTRDNGTFLVIPGQILISQACLGMILSAETKI
jgi:hypothetical protein